MKIIPLLMKYDYGIKERGESMDVRSFLPGFYSLNQEIVPFWMDENGFPDDITGLQKKILKFVDEQKPDVIFTILMNEEIKESTLIELKKKCVTVNWFGDDPWRFDIYTYKKSHLFTFSVTTDKFSLPKYDKIGYKNVIFSQWASFGYEKEIDIKNIDYKYDISFVGMKNPVRDWTINYLRKQGFEINCFGSGWQSGRVTFDEMQEIFKYSKINLNLSNSTSFDIRMILSSLHNLKFFFKNKKVEGQIKARNFEIPCFGGFQLTNYVIGLEDYLIPGKDVATFSTLIEAEILLNYYLENETERIYITEQGYKTAKKHTFSSRLQEVFEKLKKRI